MNREPSGSILVTQHLGMIGQAAGMFAVTNVDDILILALFFGQAGGRRGAALRVVAGQYLGFVAILAASVLGALGAGLLPDALIAYLGLLPLALGLRAARRPWRDHNGHDDGEDESDEDGGVFGESGPGVLAVAAVTLANGGDNIGVYAPVFATTGPGGLITYCVVFLVLVAAWCALGRFVATRPAVARVLARWGHVLLPIVLIGIGLVILLEGGVFGL